MLGLLLMLYAMEQLSGALTYYSWLLKYKLYYKKKFQGNFKLAWYYTYPGAKEAHDAQVAAEAGTAPAAKAKGAADIEEGVDKVCRWHVTVGTRCTRLLAIKCSLTAWRIALCR